MPHRDPEALALIATLSDDLRRNPAAHVALCGDWNYVDDLRLDCVGSSTDRPNVRRAMLSLFQEYNLLDSFRLLFPGRVATTHTGVQLHKPKARLDRVYISASLSPKLRNASFLPPIGDHSIATLSLGGEPLPTFRPSIQAQVFPQS